MFQKDALVAFVGFFGFLEGELCRQGLRGAADSHGGLPTCPDTTAATP